MGGLGGSGEGDNFRLLVDAMNMLTRASLLMTFLGYYEPASPFAT